MKSYRIIDLLEDVFSGDWGDEATDGNGVQVIRTTNFKEYGRISYSNIELRNIKHSVAERKMLKEGDIIIERSGGGPTQPVGRVVFFDVSEPVDEVPLKLPHGIFICNNFCSVLRPNTSVVDNEYLFHYLREYYLQGKTIKYQNKTIGLSNLNLKEYLNNEKISIHEKLSEQKIIVELINKTERLIYQRRRSISLLDDYVKNLFINMFGDPINNKKRWAQVPFSTFGSLDRGVSKKRPRNSAELLGGKYPLIQTAEVSNSGLYITSFSHTYSELGLKQSKLWKKGTLLITIAANIAKTGILSFDACFPDSIVGFVANRKKSNPIFVHFLFGFFQKIIEKNAPQAAQKNINLQLLRNLQLPQPPIKLQNKFAAIVDQTEKIKRLQNESLKKLESLYNSISHLAFQGKLNINNIVLEHIIPKSSGGKTTHKNINITPKNENKVSANEENILYTVLKKHFKTDDFSFEEMAERIQSSLNQKEYEYDNIRYQLFESLKGMSGIKLKQIFNKKEKKIFLRIKK